MKFSSIRSWFLTRMRMGTMLVRSPIAFTRYKGSIFLRRRLGDVEIPGTGSNRKNRKKNKNTKIQERLSQYGASFNRRFKGSNEEETEELNSDNRSSPYTRRPQDLAFETNRRIRPSSDAVAVLEPSTVEIPALVPSNEIRGRNGRYRCIGEAIVEEEKYRIYPGVHSSTNKPVVIKEYLLPEIEYNRQERRICKKRFASIVDIDLKSIGGQDFRVIFPLETISPPREKRCYLVTESIDKNISLKKYLEKEGALTPKQVVKFLDQVLQTLWFIHTNRLHFSDEIQNGIAHGNLSLNSILVDVKEPQTEDDEPQLFVYLGELALWEHIFVPPNSPVPEISPLQDLLDLGSISASLLIGKTETDEKNWFLASEDEEDNWLAKDEVLGRFILRLLGISSKFESALVARQELLQLEREGAFDYQQELRTTNESESNEPTQNNRRRIWKIIAIIAAIALLIGFSVILFNKISPSTTANDSVPCCIAKVKPPVGKHEYAAEDGIWSYLLEKSGYTSKNQNLRKELETRQPILENYQYEGATENAIAKLEQGSLDFALGSWHQDLPNDLEQEIVGFHGLAVFVAFSDNYRARSLPRDLKGKISVKDLRKLYTKGADDWRLPRKLRDWDVKLYVPFEKEAIALFKDLLFPDEESSAAERRQFDRLSESLLARQRREMPAPKNYSQTTRSVIENVFLDYETNKTIGIGFGYFNSVFGQCAVYPLAVAPRRKGIQPYATSEGQPITPEIDLCNDKGGYILDATEFNSGKYPLSQKLVVFYPKDEERSQAGRQFAKLLKTQESQHLLEEIGIVPLQN